MQIMTDVNRLHRQRGYQEMRFFAGVVGKANLFAAHAEYETLAAWEDEMNRMHQDGELVGALRSTIDYMDDTEIHELLVEPPDIQ